MPADAAILGFENRWQGASIPHAVECVLPSAARIRAAPPAYLLATKVEAFNDRGGEDFLGSRDFGDVITLIDGREELIAEVQQSEPELRTYLARELGRLRQHPRFREGLSGLYERTPQARRESRRSFVRAWISSSARHQPISCSLTVAAGSHSQTTAVVRDARARPHRPGTTDITQRARPGRAAQRRKKPRVYWPEGCLGRRSLDRVPGRPRWCKNPMPAGWVSRPLGTWNKAPYLSPDECCQTVATARPTGRRSRSLRRRNLETSKPVTVQLVGGHNPAASNLVAWTRRGGGDL